MTTIAGIDGDVIVYAAGFACEFPYWTIFDKATGNVMYKVTAKKFDEGQGMKIIDLKERKVVREVKGARSRQEAIDELASDCEPCKVTQNMYIEPLENCLHSVKQMIKGIVKTVGADEFKVYLTGPGNFREKIFPDYKASRKDKPKPMYKDEITEYLKKQFNAIVVEGIEADDALGIDSQRIPGFVLCSIDKDLDMIPCDHYNWNTKKRYTVEPFEGLRNFYQQILTGDAIDDIPGIKGLGPKTAEKLLKDCKTRDELEAVITSEYEKVLSKENALDWTDPGDSAYLLNKAIDLRKKLLWILRTPLYLTYPEWYEWI